MVNKKFLNVAHIAQSAGGVETALSQIIDNVDHSIFKITIIAPFKVDNVNGFNKISSKYIKLNREINPVWDFISLMRLIGVLWKIKPDIVHCHSSKAGFIGRIAAKLLGKKVVFTPHAFSFLSTESFIKKKVFLFLEKTVIPLTDVLVATSPSEACQAKNIGYPHNKVVVWQNSIKPIKLANNSSNNCGAPYFCTIGRPSYQKNIEMLVEVMKIIADQEKRLTCMLLGAGLYSPNKEAIIELINQYGLEDIFIMKEWLPRDEILQYINNSFCYVSTSRYEGLPYSLVEAMALGKPIVATDVEGNKECVIHNDNGFLVELNNERAMANKILELFYDNALRANMQQKALRRFNSHFNIEKKIHELENIYTQLTTP